MVWPMLHFPIFLADRDYGAMQFDAFCQSKKSIKFSFIHLLLLQKKFQSWTIRFDPYRPFKKKNQNAFELRCASQNFYQNLYVLNHIVLSSILYKFPRKTLFSIFIKSCIFFSIYTILNKLNQGQYGLTHIVLFKKLINFCQKQLLFQLRCIFQHIQKFQIKISYSINHIVLSRALYKFRSKAFFSYFKYFLKTLIKSNTG